MGNSNISRILTMVILDIDNKGNQIFPEFPNDYAVEFMKDEKTLDILVIKGIEKIIKFVNTNTLVFL